MWAEKASLPPTAWARTHSQTAASVPWKSRFRSRARRGTLPRCGPSVSAGGPASRRRAAASGPPGWSAPGEIVARQLAITGRSPPSSRGQDRRRPDLARPAPSLACRAQRARAAAVGRHQRHGVGVAAEAQARGAHVVGQYQVAALLVQLGPGPGDELVGVRPVSAAKPTRNGLSPLAARPQRGQQIGVGDQGQGQSVGPLPAGAAAGQLARADGRRAEIGHRRRHHDDVGLAAALSSAACISRALSTSTRRATPPGVGSDDRAGHQGDLGAPRRPPPPPAQSPSSRTSGCPESGRRRPPRRSGRRSPPPACRPALRAARDGARMASASATTSAGSTSRPAPIQPQASSPRSGPTVVTRPVPSRRRRLSWVSGCSHMFTFIAGATRMGRGRPAPRRPAGRRPFRPPGGRWRPPWRAR